MAGTVDDSNEKHLEPWSAACERDGIHSTPLSPYLDQVGTRSSKTNLKPYVYTAGHNPKPVHSVFHFLIFLLFEFQNYCLAHKCKHDKLK